MASVLLEIMASQNNRNNFKKTEQINRRETK